MAASSSICDLFHQSPIQNPQTGHKITIGGPKYRYFVKMCGLPKISTILGLYNDPTIYGIIHGIYMTTNETRPIHSQAMLLNTHRVINGCHIGVAAWHNFDIMVIRKSTYGLIFDFNPQNKKFMDATIALIQKASTRDQFIKLMQIYLKTNPIHFMLKPGMSSIDEMINDSKLPESWLFNDSNYEFIRNRVLDDAIVAITQDIKNTSIFANIHAILNDFGITIDTVYLSNVCIFMQTLEDQTAFVSTLYSIITPTTLVINCPQKRHPSYPYEDITNPLDQQINLGSDFINNPSKFFIM